MLYTTICGVFFVSSDKSSSIELDSNVVHIEKDVLLPFIIFRLIRWKT
jgi:hypothetical protein